jgi:hypothetical protein
MPRKTNANNPADYNPTPVTVNADPDHTTAGGTVLLTVDLPPVQATYKLLWEVLGPVRLTKRDTEIALLGATTVTGGTVTLPLEPDNELRATLDTTRLTLGSWRVRVELTKVDDDDERAEVASGADNDQPPPPNRIEGTSPSIVVGPRPFAAGDDVAVTLRRTAVPPTADQPLWVKIRNSANAVGFNNYSRFIDVVVCGEPPDPESSRLGSKHVKHKLHKVKHHTALPFPNVDRYRLLKATTEVFLMIHCGVALDDFTGVDLEEESGRLNRTVRPGELEAEMQDYLVRVAAGEDAILYLLPYLELIQRKLRDVPIVGIDRDAEEAAEICFGILAEKLTNPCFLELLWSYWHEEGLLVQAMNAISWRFQNRTSAVPGRNPLANLEVDPLRPLNNLLWGYIQDREHRLTTVRRAYEYDHHYGLVLASKPGPPVRGADSRSRFVDAFHHLLVLSAEFHERDDDTTVIADGFSVLNALKEVHLLLTEGQHNQYGDLPWTARHEMLMEQWILSRPEMRDWLSGRIMVAYPEEWMGPVDAMNRLQGWSDTSVLHFRDLGVFGEQLLLSIRFGAWSTVIAQEQAANWARYWRAELQGYIHAYRAVTGVDLLRRRDRSIPAFHLRRRIGAYRG